jgi:hypothetical protein
VATTDFAGTWKLNLAKSEIPPVTKSQVLTIDTDGVHVTMTEELVNDKGETLVISVEGRFDGQDYPVNGTPFADTVSYRLLDPHTIEGIAKKNGRVCVRETAVLSQDGLVVRVTYLSDDERGNTHTSHGVFERIDPHLKGKRPH